MMSSEPRLPFESAIASVNLIPAVVVRWWMLSGRMDSRATKALQQVVSFVTTY